MTDSRATLLERVPPDRVAVQWDVAVEFGLLEGAMGPAVPLERIAPGLVRCVDVVRDDVPVGLHLCYGDYGHQHFRQPESLRMQVEVVNAVGAGARRPLNWASLTVPQADRVAGAAHRRGPGGRPGVGGSARSAGWAAWPPGTSHACWTCTGKSSPPDGPPPSAGPLPA